MHLASCSLALHTFFILIAELELMTKPENRRRYSKHIVFAVELFGVSPAAHRMLRRSKSIILPHERRVREIDLPQVDYCHE